MITKKLEEALNKQVPSEAYAASSYLSMASWCEKEGLRGSAGFFYEQAAEEREHMLKIVKYINEAGGHALIPSVKEPPNSYKSISHAFETALDQERSVTEQINNLVDLSLSKKDYSAFHFLQWFVGEQLEEEALFKTILDIIKHAGKDSRAPLLVDNEIARVRAAEAKG